MTDGSMNERLVYDVLCKLSELESQLARLNQEIHDLCRKIDKVIDTVRSEHESNLRFYRTVIKWLITALSVIVLGSKVVTLLG